VSLARRQALAGAAAAALPVDAADAVAPAEATISGIGASALTVGTANADINVLYGLGVAELKVEGEPIGPPQRKLSRAEKVAAEAERVRLRIERNVPTVSGLYWVRDADAPDAEWEPAKFTRSGRSEEVDVLGWDVPQSPLTFIWGAKLEPPS